MSRPGAVTAYGGPGSCFFAHSTLAIIAPSGTARLFAGIPSANALIMTGFQRTALMHPGAGAEPHPPASSGWLGAITCQASYPLNSEQASPLVTFRME